MQAQMTPEFVRSNKKLHFLSYKKICELQNVSRTQKLISVREQLLQFLSFISELIYFLFQHVLLLCEVVEISLQHFLLI